MFLQQSQDLIGVFAMHAYVLAYVCNSIISYNVADADDADILDEPTSSRRC